VLPALAPGVYYLLAQADATGAVAESSEADNTRAKTLVVGPDLVVTAITTVPSAPVSTAPTTIAVTTRNNGGAASGPTLTRLYRSVNGKVDPTDPVLATFVVPGLDPGASDTQSVTVTLPAGGYNLLGLCDADGTEAEARETNNRRRLALVVP
jgi:subtilase family serine protease